MFQDSFLGCFPLKLFDAIAGIQRRYSNVDGRVPLFDGRHLGWWTHQNSLKKADERDFFWAEGPKGAEA